VAEIGVIVGDDRWDRAAALRNDLGIRVRVTAANVAGAVLVALEVIVVGLPAGNHGARFHHDNIISALIGVGYLVVVVALEDALSRRRADRTFGWIGERRHPTQNEVGAVFDYPWIQARSILVWWLGAAALFVVLNLSFGNNAAYCLRLGLGIILGGLTSSSLSFLLLERFNRPVFALALAGEPGATSGRLGLQRRLLLTWALGAAVPVLVIVSAPAGLSSSQRARLAGPLLIIGAIALAAGFALTVVASRSITEPIDALRASQGRVEDGDLAVEVPVDDGGEVGLLQAGFNRMVAGLRERQRIRDLFGRHVGAEVARRALSMDTRLGGELRESSVLFVDLIGSTSLAQRLSPEHVVELLNEFFSAVVRSAAAEGGWVNKFEGDAALCIFGPPTEDADHAAEALRAARLMHTALSALATDHPGFDAGIGVSTGMVVAGNVGAEDRYEYTVIGDPVNEAARLTEAAKLDPGRVLASGAAFAAAGEEAIHWRRCGAQVLRGRAEPTELYGPIEQSRSTGLGEV
jgi:adenylate cyclase